MLWREPQPEKHGWATHARRKSDLVGHGTGIHPPFPEERFGHDVTASGMAGLRLPRKRASHPLGRLRRRLAQRQGDRQTGRSSKSSSCQGGWSISSSAEEAAPGADAMAAAAATHGLNAPARRLPGPAGRDDAPAGPHFPPASSTAAPELAPTAPNPGCRGAGLHPGTGRRRSLFCLLINANTAKLNIPPKHNTRDNPAESRAGVVGRNTPRWSGAQNSLCDSKPDSQTCG